MSTSFWWHQVQGIVLTISLESTEVSGETLLYSNDPQGGKKQTHEIWTWSKTYFFTKWIKKKCVRGEVFLTSFLTNITQHQSSSTYYMSSSNIKLQCFSLVPSSRCGCLLLLEKASNKWCAKLPTQKSTYPCCQLFTVYDLHINPWTNWNCRVFVNAHFLGSLQLHSPCSVYLLLRKDGYVAETN